MSSTSIRKPEFRLRLGYAEVTLRRSDRPGETRLAPPSDPAFADDLRRLAAAVAEASGRLTVILPDREVWRGQPPIAGRTAWARRRAARATAAAALGAAPGEIAVVIGRPTPQGTLPVAATRRDTIAGVRRMLAAVGLRPDTIRGDGRFDGFVAPPPLGGLRWRPLGRRLPARVAPRAAGAAGGVAVAIAALLAILASEAPAPVVSAGPLIHQSVAREATTFAAAAPVPLAPPAHPPATVHAAAAPERVAPPASRPKPTAPLFSINTRNVDLVAAKPGALPRLSLPGAGPEPLPRPKGAGAAAERPAAPSTAGLGPVPRPLPRPAPTRAIKAELARTAAIDTDDFARPQHRPEAAAAVEVASLTPASAIVAALAAAQAPAPLARPDDLAGTEPARKPAPASAPAAAIPAPPRPEPAAKPKLVRAATAGALAAKPLLTAPPVAAAPVIRAMPAPQPKVVAVAPTPKVVPIAPTRVALAAATPKAQQTARAATPVADAAPAPAVVSTRPQTGLSRGKLSLIGVFGDTDAPHALVRLPSGQIERVRAGDSVAGMQVASVSASGVRVRGGGRETLLALPD